MKVLMTPTPLFEILYTSHFMFALAFVLYPFVKFFFVRFAKFFCKNPKPPITPGGGVLV